MVITYRALTEEDWDEWVAGNARGFLEDIEAASTEADPIRPHFDFDRSLGAFDGDELVGKTHSIPFSMSVPGGELPTAGVTAITVSPTHRRRGILTELMRRQLADIRDRGEALAALWASESLIYGRFGYGMAAQSDRVSIDRRHTAFLAEVSDAPGEVRFVAPEDARERWPALYDRLRESRPGMMTRFPYLWRGFVIPRTEKPDDGFTRRLYVEYADSQGPEGYAIYAVKPGWREDVPHGTLRVHELVALTPAAEAALWRYLFGVDLIGMIEADNRPPDDPLVWMLADPRQLRRMPRDSLWVHILDVVKALEGRAYLADGRLVLEVTDDFGPWAAGCFDLTIESGKATCRRTDASPDITLGANALAAVYLGGASPSVLARAGRIAGSPDALRLSDALFRWHTSPWCIDEF